MAFLNINGWNINVSTNGASESNIVVGDSNRSVNGTLRSTVQTMKKQYKCKTTPLSAADGAALKGLLNKNICGHAWDFDDDLYSSKGLAAAITRATVAYKTDGTSVASGAARYENGKYISTYTSDKGLVVEEGTANMLTANQSSVETDTLEFASVNACITPDSLVHFNGTNGSTTITDDYGNAWTCAGTAQLSTTTPKFGTAKGLLDGNSDYFESLSFKNLGRTFCIECWWYTTDTTQQEQNIFSAIDDNEYGVIARFNVGGNNKLTFWISSHGLNWNVANGATGTDTTWANNTWYHIALEFDIVAETYQVFLDGVLDWSLSSPYAPCAITHITLGANHFGATANSYLKGGIDEFRFTPNVVRYGSPFTPSATEFTAETLEYWNGTKSLRCYTLNSGASEGFYTANTTVTESLSYTASVYLYGSGTVQLRLNERTDADANVGSTTSAAITLSSTWTRYSVTRAFGATGKRARIYVETDVQQYIGFSTDGVQLEQKAYATSWHIGAGTRNAEVITGSTDVFNKYNWTVSMWYKPTANPASISGARLFTIYIDANNYYLMGFSTTTGKAYGSVTSGGTTYTTYNASDSALSINTWYLLTFTGDGTSIRFYINGVLQTAGAVAYTEASGTLPTSFYLGSTQGGATQANGYYSDLIISKYVWTTAQTLGFYNASRPYSVLPRLNVYGDFLGRSSANILSCEANLGAIEFKQLADQRQILDIELQEV